MATQSVSPAPTALAVVPASEENLLSKAKKCFTAGEVHLATKEARAAVDSFLAAEKLLKSASGNEELLFAVYRRLATVYMQMKQMDKALEMYKKASEMLVNSRKVEGKELSVEDMEELRAMSVAMYEIYVELDRFADCIDALKQISAYTPRKSNDNDQRHHDGSILLALADAYHKSEQTGKALVHFRKCMAVLEPLSRTQRSGLLVAKCHCAIAQILSKDAKPADEPKIIQAKGADGAKGADVKGADGAKDVKPADELKGAEAKSTQGADAKSSDQGKEAKPADGATEAKSVEQGKGGEQGKEAKPTDGAKEVKSAEQTKETKNLDEAIAHLHKALKIRRHLLSEEDASVQITHRDLGQAYLLKKDYANAKEHLMLALALLRHQPASLQNQIQNHMSLYRALAEVHDGLGSPAMSAAFSKKAANVITEMLQKLSADRSRVEATAAATAAAGAGAAAGETKAKAVEGKKGEKKEGKMEKKEAADVPVVTATSAPASAPVPAPVPTTPAPTATAAAATVPAATAPVAASAPSKDGPAGGEAGAAAPAPVALTAAS